MPIGAREKTSHPPVWLSQIYINNIIVYALNEDLNRKLLLAKFVKNGEILCPHGETGSSYPKRGDIHVRRRSWQVWK